MFVLKHLAAGRKALALAAPRAEDPALMSPTPLGWSVGTLPGKSKAKTPTNPNWTASEENILAYQNLINNAVEIQPPRFARLQGNACLRCTASSLSISF
jgi:hypothetical protein